jgi:hypothetical protein
MPITPLAHALKMPIKEWARRHGIMPSQMFIQSSAGKAGYITVSIKSINRDLEFPLEERIKALKIIYPNHPDCWSGSAGNIHSNMMTMVAEQWAKFMEESGIQVDSIKEMENE